MSKNKLISVEDAESRIDQLFVECGWSANHPAMLDWVTIKFALKDARLSKGSAEQQTDNKPSMLVCPHYSREMVKSSEYVEFDICTCKGNTGKPAHVG